MIPKHLFEALVTCSFGKRPLPPGIGVTEDERRDAIRVQPIEHLGEDAAPGQPEYSRTIDADDVEEPRKTPRPIRGRKRLRRVGRGTRARRVPREDPEAIGEACQLGSPASGIRQEPVQQYQRGAFPDVSVGHGKPVHLDVSQLGASHVSMMPP